MNFPLAILQTAIIFGAAGLGGGVYETLLVDRAWPRMPLLIQPERGGIDRKLFWIPMHVAYELALLVAAWANWQTGFTRYCILAALAAHGITRAWSFLHFIPAAVGFERAGDLDASQTAAAWAWTRQSRWRVVIEVCGVLVLALALSAVPHA